jgi:hypothetical protein
MEFFNSEDFEYFASIQRLKIKRGSQESDAIRTTLTLRSVYAKTNFWAEQLRQFGFEIEMSWHWQYSGNIRSYTWAKIYLPGDNNTRIFFTVGVGSRFTENLDRVNTLEYKLDCLRKNDNKGLSPAQILQVDNYIRSYCPETERQMIDLEQLPNYNWDRLVTETYQFISVHLENYREIIGIVWPNGVGIEQKIARLCWNDFRWRKPSGDNGKSKSNAQPFEQEKGYGYEEWLFDLEKQVNGYHYGFIQAFHKGDHKGKIYDLALYSIYYDNNQSTSNYYWIGNIKKAIVLTTEEKIQIRGIYEINGWISEMLSQLNEVGIDKFNEDYIEPDNIFNVKFKASIDSYVLFEQPQPIYDPEHQIGGNTHYVLLNRLNNSEIADKVSGRYKFKEGHNTTLTGTINAQLTKNGYVKTLKHKKIQENIFNQLVLQFNGTDKKVGTEVPTGRGTLIDLVVSSHSEGDTFYEIKTGGSALKCIREGIGQLFEYHFYPSSKNASKLIIVAPFQPDAFVKEYITHLRNSTDIAIFYQEYSYKDEKLIGMPI